MEPSTVADIVVEGIRGESTLIMTHPEMKTYVERKVADHDRWVNGMARHWERSKALLA